MTNNYHDSGDPSSVQNDREQNLYEDTTPHYSSGDSQYQDTEPVKSTVKLMPSIRFGISSTFRNPLLILGVFLTFVVMFAVSFLLSLAISMVAGFDSAVNPDTGELTTDGFAFSSILSLSLNIPMAIVSILLTIILYHIGMKALQSPKIQFQGLFSGMKLLPAVGAYLLASLVQLVIFTLAILVLLVPVGVLLLWGMDPLDTNTYIPRILFLGVVATIMSFFVIPFILLAPFYALDGHSVTDSVMAGLRDAKKYYWVLMGYTLLTSVVGVLLGMVTLGLGFLIVIPVTHIALAHLYYQINNKDIVHVTA